MTAWPAVLALPVGILRVLPLYGSHGRVGLICGLIEENLKKANV